MPIRNSSGNRHPKNNLNNHPLKIEDHLGVHNGNIKNDDRLFSMFRFPRLGEVDSEIIFRLFNEVKPTDKRYSEKLTEKVRLLEGTFATISIDLRDPFRLVVIKNKNPLCIHYHEPWKALIFSSRYIFLRKAFGRSVVTEALKSGHLHYFYAEDIMEKRHIPTARHEIFTS